jgi:methylphosphotriester-DNA--protein-cysteine methyltransferase
MMTALEQLAHGDSVGNVADAVGCKAPSSLIAALSASFDTTPTAYFQDMQDRRASKE